MIFKMNTTAICGICQKRPASNDCDSTCIFCGEKTCNYCSMFMKHDPNNSLVSLPIQLWYCVCEQCNKSKDINGCSYCYNLLPRFFYKEKDGCVICKGCQYQDFKNFTFNIPAIEASLLFELGSKGLAKKQ